MVMSTSKSLGHGGEGLGSDDKGSFAYLIRQLQQVKHGTAAGAAANTNIPIAGIKVGDHITSVVSSVSGTLSLVNLATVTIQSDGNIRCSGATTGASLLVTWYPETPAKV